MLRSGDAHAQPGEIAQGDWKGRNKIRAKSFGHRLAKTFVNSTDLDTSHGIEQTNELIWLRMRGK